MLGNLTDLKLYLGIDDTDSDTLLTNLLGYANDYVKSYTRNNFEQQEYTEKFDGENKCNVVPKQYPIVSITSFQYNEGTLGAPVWTDYDSENYNYDDVIIYTSFLVSRGNLKNKLVYTAGYLEADLPQDIILAIYQLCGFSYNTKESNGIVSEKIDSGELKFSDSQSIPTTILNILNKYKNVQAF